MPKKKSEPALDETMEFETALGELNTIVEYLEKGGLSIETALEKFERGIFLTRFCQKSLKEAEQKVALLTEKNGTFELQSCNTSLENNEL